MATPKVFNHEEYKDLRVTQPYQSKIKDWKPEQLAFFNRMAEVTGQVFTIYVTHLSYPEFYRLMATYPKLSFMVWSDSSRYTLPSLND